MAANRTYRVLLVDDAYLALNLLEEFVGRVPGMVLVDKCKSPMVALDLLQTQPIDILFLDIQMPTLSGMSLLKSLVHPPATIFTTAYREYAADAFELSAIDYLVKPFSFERFLQALNKAKAACAIQDPAPAPAEHLTLKVDGKLVRIKIADILYVEGMKEYIRIVSATQKWVTFERMKNIEDRLPTHQFLRVHKSYLVAREHVTAIAGNRLEVGGHLVPISRDQRPAIVQVLFG